jgi:hypothetical protein
VVNSQNSLNFLPYLVQDLGFMILRGEVAGVQSQDDVVTFTVLDKAYSAPGTITCPIWGSNGTKPSSTSWGLATVPKPCSTWDRA